MVQAVRTSLVARLRSRQGGLILGTAIIVLSVGFLSYFVYRNWPALSTHSWVINHTQLALTLAFHLLAFAVAIAAWHSVIRRLSGSGDLGLNARIYCYSAVARRLPGVAWDIATRLAMYDQAGVSKAVVGVASAVEWLMITLSGVLLYLGLTPFTSSHGPQVSAWALIGALGVGAILTHPRLITYAVRRVRQDQTIAPLRYRDTLWWMFLYGWTWIISGLMLYSTICTIYPLQRSHLAQLMSDWALVGILTSFASFLPTSLALREVTLTLLMSRYLPEYIAVVAAILMRFLTVAYSILWTICSSRLQRAASRR